MIIRLAVIGAALTIGGLLNVGGFGKYTLPLGIIVLAVTGALHLVGRRKARE